MCPHSQTDIGLVCCVFFSTLVLYHKPYKCQVDSRKFDGRDRWHLFRRAVSGRGNAALALLGFRRRFLAVSRTDTVRLPWVTGTYWRAARTSPKGRSSSIRATDPCLYSTIRATKCQGKNLSLERKRRRPEGRRRNLAGRFNHRIIGADTVRIPRKAHRQSVC